MKIDLNADVGEGFHNDAALMPFISSANIACGYHAGNKETIKATIALCLQHGVAVGAHPSFPDKENFGRKEMWPSPQEIKELLLEQLAILTEACHQLGATLHHVKPHGALYNMSAKDRELAQMIAETIYGFNPHLKLYGLSGSHSIAEGVMAGLGTVAEVFADRTYRDDGSLTPRTQPNAIIQDEAQAIEQAMNLAVNQQVKTMSGATIPLLAESICLHGDTPHAVSFTRLIHQNFQQLGINIQAVT
jgi:5-oxoprolinase (ATP-hydrolysing) subunit A